MQEVLDAFVHHAREQDLHVLYGQICRAGEALASWSRFSVRSRMECFSVTKTFAAVGVGIAIDEGLLTLDVKVADSFPEATYDIDNPFALDITVEDMLKMSSGLETPLFFRDSVERRTVKDHVRYFYEKGRFVRKPGEKFLYSNFNTYMLSCLVEKKAGTTLHEYLRYRLFEPLGIGNPDMTACPYGHTMAANGLQIDVDELARFGEFLLRRGEHNGKQLVSAAYIEKFMTPHIATERKVPTSADGDTFSYGYQIWIDTINRCWFLWGIFGNYCLLLPEKDTVISILSFEENDAAVAQLLWDDIVTKI